MFPARRSRPNGPRGAFVTDSFPTSRPVTERARGPGVTSGQARAAAATRCIAVRTTVTSACFVAARDRASV